ncbi:hypothetical protein [Sphingobacterium sp. Ag1]|uniref:hypothetical protein n=1 Tax=Sphingobacterium sp. Ag1 TaxID=1643451 RepID=UPI000A575D83|nr:hypothetical protein [Sphingobacterium sp. Ag1]
MIKNRLSPKLEYQAPVIAVIEVEMENGFGPTDFVRRDDADQEVPLLDTLSQEEDGK